MNTSRNHESGQAIILLVISLVVLLGFTALAIDGGMVYSDRRHAQNAADTASLAGAGMAGSIIQDRRISVGDWSCSNILNYVVNDASDTAVLRAASNGYTITRIIGGNYSNPYAEGSFSDENNRVVIECIDNGTNKFLNVKTQIQADTQTSFAHILYNGPLRNRVEAIARVQPQTPLAYGNAVVATNPNACQGNQNGLQFVGTSFTQITNGGALSLGCLDVDGQGNRSSYIEADGVIYVVEWDGSFADKFINGSPDQGNAEDYDDEDMFTVPEPDCYADGMESRTLPGGNPSEVTLQPGRYSERISITNNQTFTLMPGLYCLGNSPNSLVMNGGTLIGEGMTIYAPNGDVSVTGGTFRLIGPCTYGDVNNVGGDPQLSRCMGTDPEDDYPEPAISGVVIYSYGDVTFVGNGESLLTGMIYAPTGNVTLNGTSDISPTLNTQIIAYNVFVGGTGRLVINFDDENTYLRPTRLDMLR
jgi:hypothetical protein